MERKNKSIQLENIHLQLSIYYGVKITNYFLTQKKKKLQLVEKIQKRFHVHENRVKI